MVILYSVIWTHTIYPHFFPLAYPARMITDTAYFQISIFHGLRDRAETMDNANITELVWILNMATSRIATE